MALRYWAHIFLSPGFNPKNHTIELSSSTCRFKAIGLDFQDKSQVTEIAKQLVAEGVQLIELCGGFGPEWIAKVREATQYAIPVGGAFYGPEARRPMLEILDSSV
jgi:hypothetical protein